MNEKGRKNLKFQSESTNCDVIDFLKMPISIVFGNLDVKIKLFLNNFNNFSKAKFRRPVILIQVLQLLRCKN